MTKPHSGGSTPVERSTKSVEPTEPVAPLKGLLSVPAHGLPPRDGPRKRVIVLGAGLAGLVAGYELLRQGHDPVILEARRRVGGRIYTLRDFAPGLYAEVGAMRIPRVHDLTLSYCRELCVRTRPGRASNPNAFAYIDGRRITLKEAEAGAANPAFPLARHEVDRTREDMWLEATEEVRELYQREGDAAVEALAAKYDAYSIRGFLKARGWSEGAIERYGVLTFTESTLNTSVMQEFREVLGEAYEDVQEPVGGMDQLPLAFYEHLKAHIRFGTEVFALEQDAQSVTVRAYVGTDPVTVTGDAAICTLPFSVLRGIEVSPSFSRAKQRAIRQLHYDAATKVFFQMRRPFWEATDGIRGGTTVTDLPVRRIIYPANTVSLEDRTVLLASYTWGQDALQWSAMEPAQRIRQALRDLERIHPGLLEEFEAGMSYSWYQDPYAMGAYALFEPEQHTLFRDDIKRPEGRIYFAGEHTSRWPAWLEGAAESGVLAAYQVHAA
jgi:monoamine oxidase